MADSAANVNLVAKALAAPVLALALAACSSSSGLFGTSSSGESSDWFGTRLGTVFSRPAPTPAGGADQANAQQKAVEVDCPGVAIREGASTLMVNPPNVDPTPLNLRYQGTIVRTARECAVLGATITLRVGIQGRVILGPQGGPGQLEVPLRYALVKEGPEPKTVWTKVHRVNVVIPPDRPNVSFSHVEEDMTVPMPPGNEIDDYVVYVGFDPKAEEPKPNRGQRARPRVAEPRGR